MIVLYDLLHNSEHRFGGSLDKVEMQLRHMFSGALDKVPDGDINAIFQRINHMSYWIIKEENERPVK